MKIYLVIEGLYLYWRKKVLLFIKDNCRIKFGYFNIKCGGGIEIYVYVYFFVNEIIFCFFILFDIVLFVYYN